jgi:sugar lactone lactonase YvrE
LDAAAGAGGGATDGGGAGTGGAGGGVGGGRAGDASSSGGGADGGNGIWDASSDAASDGEADASTNDAANPERTTDTGNPILELVAGRLGGPGNVDGTGTAARFFHPSGVTSDGAGNLFVADTNNHTIRKVVIATGEVTSLAGSGGSGTGTPAGMTDGTGTAARFYSPSDVTSDGEGNLFVADSGNNMIRKVVIATGEVTTLALGFKQPTGVASDGVGNLFVADNGSHTIRKVVIASGKVTTLAGSAGNSGSADGTGTAARFCNPYGVANDGAGNVFVTDNYDSHYTIRKVVIATGEVTTLAGSSGYRTLDGTGTAAQFYHPSGVASDGAGNLFVADNLAIRKVVIATGEVTTLAGSADEPGSDDGTGTAARFRFPHGVASDGTGNLFVADADNNTIRKVIVATGEVTTLAGSVKNAGATDGTGAAARFNGPTDIARDGASNLFVADTNNNTIRKVVIATGEVTTLAPWFSYPSGVMSDGADNLFVADSLNRTVCKVVIATGQVTTLMEPTQTNNLYYPYGVASDGAGNLFVSSYQNDFAILKIVIATGEVTTLALGFNQPTGMASDGVGNLFVADNGSHTIRKVIIATGEVTVLAGSQGKSGSQDGKGTTARFNGPSDVTSDGAGNLFVADTYNHTIRKVVIATGEVTTVVGTPGRARVLLGPLPAELNAPTGVAFVPPRSLFITDQYDNAVLVARF